MPVRAGKRKTVLPARVPQSKRYDYIKKIEVDGFTRLRAYAEVIDPRIYDLTPAEITVRLNYLRKAWPDYEDLRQMILAEQADWNLRRSVAAQEKAIELLNVTLDKAIDMAKDPNADVKEFNAAVSTLKTIIPALTASKQPIEKPAPRHDAAKFIN